MNETDILYSKEGFTFAKIKKNNYTLHFKMENNTIVLSNIIDFNLVKLIYELNGDIYEKVNLTKIDDNQAVMSMLMKHLFEDIGLPQRFSYVHMTKQTDSNKITFISKSIYSERPEGMPESSEQMPITNMVCECNIITPHKMGFSCNVIFDDHMIIPQFAEKLVGLILFKIFNRVKQFIENVRM
jgi:hypothetical protein